MIHKEKNSEEKREVCGLIAELAQRIDVHIRRNADLLQLTAPQAVALRELDAPLTLKQLAARMCCEASNATFIADRLEAMGFLIREPHPTDRRAKQLTLTGLGHKKRQDLLELLSYESPLGPLSEQEQLALKTLLYRAISQAD